MQFVISAVEVKRLAGKVLELLKSNENVLLTSKSNSSEMLRFEELIEAKKSDTEKVVAKFIPIVVICSFVEAKTVFFTAVELESVVMREPNSKITKFT